MKFVADIDIMPLDNLLDPQGEAVKHTLHGLDFKSVEKVRIGKHLQIELEADGEQQAKEIVERICRDVLYNPVVHKYTYTIRKAD